MRNMGAVSLHGVSREDQGAKGRQPSPLLGAGKLAGYMICIEGVPAKFAGYAE